MPSGPRSQTYYIGISRGMRENGGGECLVIDLNYSLGSISRNCFHLGGCKQLLALSLCGCGCTKTLILTASSLCSNILGKMSAIHSDYTSLGLGIKSLFPNPTLKPFFKQSKLQQLVEALISLKLISWEIQNQGRKVGKVINAGEAIGTYHYTCLFSLLEGMPLESRDICSILHLSGGRGFFTDVMTI